MGKLYHGLTQGTASNFEMASGYDMNAKPLPPELITWSTSTPNSCAKFPKIPKIVVPASREVNVSRVVTTKASLRNGNKSLHKILPLI